MSEKKHVLNFIEQAVIDSLYRFQEGLYPKDGELHDEHGNVIESGFLLRESIRPVPKMLLCASLWPKTSADKKTSVGLQGMEAALSVLQEHGLVREMPRPRMVYGAWKRADGLIFESLETARAGEAKYRIRRANGEPILEADPFTIEGASWTRGYELTSAGIDHARNTQAAPTTAHATKNGEVTITDAMSPKDTPPRPAAEPEANVRPDPVAVAIAILKDHPKWSNRKVAQAAGCHHTTLGRSEFYRTAKARLREAQKERSIKRGWKDKDGNIEAIDE